MTYKIPSNCCSGNKRFSRESCANDVGLPKYNNNLLY